MKRVRRRFTNATWVTNADAQSSTTAKTRASRRLRVWIAVAGLIATLPQAVVLIAFDISQRLEVEKNDEALEVFRHDIDRLTASDKSSIRRLTTEGTSNFLILPGLMALVVVVSIGLALLVTDYQLTRWLRYFRDIALAHSSGRSSARAIGVGRLPESLTDLALQMNHMADSIDARAVVLEDAITEGATLLHEIHHRVKNNFAIVASLLSLHKKSLPAELRPDIRFLEEHVHATAIAYRVAYAAADTSSVPAVQLTREVIEALREIAGCSSNEVIINSIKDETVIGLDKAIALGLCLAYRLPPYLSGCLVEEAPITISIAIAEDNIVVAFDASPHTQALAPALRTRLAEAYLRQLDATLEINETTHRGLIHVPVTT